jgi:hypothetical protein
VQGFVVVASKSLYIVCTMKEKQQPTLEIFGEAVVG